MNSCLAWPGRALAGFIPTLVGCALAASVCQARTIIVIGALTSGIDSSERIYHDENRPAAGETTGTTTRTRDTGDARQIFIAPMLIVRADGPRDTLELQYAPVARYDTIPDEGTLDHQLRLHGMRLLTRDWSVTLNEQFVSADSPSSSSSLLRQAQTSPEASLASSELPRDQLSSDLGRQRFFTNDAGLKTDYTFTQDSTLGLGYSHRLLRNDSSSGQYTEFDRHELATGFSWKPRQNWLLAWDGWYVIGDFSPPASSVPTDGTATDEGTAAATTTDDGDLHEYRSRARLTYAPDSRTKYPLTYDFKATDYQGSRSDSRAHELILGWERAMANDFRLLFGAGPAYSEIDGANGSWGYSGYGGLEKDWSQGRLECRLEKRLESENFTGTDNTGLTDTYLGRMLYTHHLSEALDGSISLLLRDERKLNPQGRSPEAGDDPALPGGTEYRKRRYEGGFDLNYKFWQRYALSGGYTFARQEADLDDESYNEHLFLVRLAVEKEWWRW